MQKCCYICIMQGSPYVQPVCMQMSVAVVLCVRKMASKLAEVFPLSFEVTECCIAKLCNKDATMLLHYN